MSYNETTQINLLIRDLRKFNYVSDDIIRK